MEGRGESVPKEPTAADEDAGAWLKLRDGGNYRRPAAQIVNSLEDPVGRGSTRSVA